MEGPASDGRDRVIFFFKVVTIKFSDPKPTGTCIFGQIRIQDFYALDTDKKISFIVNWPNQTQIKDILI